MLIGVWVALLLFLGLPTSYDRIILVVTGFILVMVGYGMPARRTDDVAALPYVEHRASADADNDPHEVINHNSGMK